MSAHLTSHPWKYQTQARYFVLSMICITSIGGYFASDAVGALNDDIREYMGITHTQFGLLYSIGSAPSVALSFFSGMLIDRIGAYNSSMLYSTVISCGTLLVCFAATWKSFYTMLAGRLMSGTGQLMLASASSTLTAIWFKNHDLSFAVGAGLAASHLGTVVTFDVESSIAARAGFLAALWFAFIVCMMSWISNLVLLVFSRFASRHMNIYSSESADVTSRQVKDVVQSSDKRLAATPTSPSTSSTTSNNGYSNGSSISNGVSVPAASPNLRIEENGITVHPNQYRNDSISSEKADITPLPLSLSGHSRASPKFTFRSLIQLKNLPVTFWIACLVCASFYSCLFPFFSISTSLLQDQFGFTLQDAGFYTSLAPLGSTILGIPIGFILDRTKRQGYVVILGLLCLTTGHATLFFVPQFSILFSYCMLGLAFAITSTAFWATIPMLVPSELTGTAYGLIFTFENAALLLNFTVVGAVRDAYPCCVNLGWLFVGISIISVTSAIVWNIVDRVYYGAVLNYGVGVQTSFTKTPSSSGDSRSVLSSLISNGVTSTDGDGAADTDTDTEVGTAVGGPPSKLTLGQGSKYRRLPSGDDDGRI